MDQLPTLHLDADALIAAPIVDGDVAQVENIRVFDLDANLLDAIATGVSSGANHSHVANAALNNRVVLLMGKAK